MTAGVGEVRRAVDGEPHDQPTRLSLLRAIEAMVGPGGKRLALSRTALSVLALARRPDVAFEEVSARIELDPSFAAGVQRLASSPVYDTAIPIRTIPQALQRLGIRMVSDLCLEVALSERIFRAPEFDLPMEAIRRHSVAVGHIARRLCERSAIRADDVFTLGLCHDAGVAAAVLALRTKGLWTRRIELEEAWPVILQCHGELTAKLFSLWSFAPAFTGTLRGHHEIPKFGKPEQAALVLADHLASEMGRGLPEVGREQERMSARAIERAREQLGMPHARLVAIAFEVTRLLDEMG